MKTQFVERVQNIIDPTHGTSTRVISSDLHDPYASVCNELHVGILYNTYTMGKEFVGPHTRTMAASRKKIPKQAETSSEPGMLNGD